MDNIIKFYDRVVMLTDLDGSDIKSGDVGVVVEIYPGGVAYEVEFFALDGSTISVETVPAAMLKKVSRTMMMHIRELAA